MINAVQPGKEPKSSDFWKSLVKMGPMALQYSFRIFAATRYGPVAFLFLIFDNSFNTLSSVIVICWMSALQFLSSRGRELVFSTLNTELNCLFRASSLSVAEVAILPSVLLRVAIPKVCCIFLFFFFDQF